MKLHLPKTLLTAVLAVLAVSGTQVTAAESFESITHGDNFWASSYTFSFVLNDVNSNGSVVAAYWGTSSTGDLGSNGFTVAYDSATQTYTLSAGAGKLNDININASTTFTNQPNGNNPNTTTSITGLQAGVLYTVTGTATDGNTTVTVDSAYSDPVSSSSYLGKMNGDKNPPNSGINSAYAVNNGTKAIVWKGTTEDASVTDVQNWQTITNGPIDSLQTTHVLVFENIADVSKTIDITDLNCGGINTYGEYTLTTTGTLNVSGTVHISEGGKLKLNGDSTASIGNIYDFSCVEGSSDLELTSGTSYLRGGNSEEAKVSTKLTGSLIIKNGATLRLGYTSNEGGNKSTEYVDLSSLESIELAGGTLSTRVAVGNLGDINVTADSVFNPIDINDPGTNQLSVGTIDLTANLTVKTCWKANINVDGITGTGNLTFTNTDGDSLGRDLYINSVNGFTGKLTVDNAKHDNGVNKNTNPGRLHVTIGEEETLSASQLAVNTQDGSITLYGAGTFNVAADGSIAKGTWKTQRTEGEQTIVEEHTGEKGSFANTWTGTAVLNNVTLAGTDLHTYGNAGSTVKLVNSTGTLRAGDINTKVQFGVNGSEAPALKTTGRNANQTFTFTKAVSGNGNFCIESSVPTDGTEDNNYKADTYKFTGDTSAWNGKLIAGNNTHTNVEFDGTTAINNEIDATNGATMNASIVNNSGVTVNEQVNQNPWSGTDSAGTINLTVSNKTAESTGSVTFADVVNVSTATLGENVSAVFNSTSTLGTLTLNAGASVTGAGPLNISNLVMSDGSSIAADSAITLGGMLSINGVVTLDGGLLDGLSSLTASDTLTLFTGVSTLALNGTEYSTVTRNLLGEADLATYFTGVESGQFYLGYDNGTVYAGKVVPEPTTATLSLLALAALAARRRRK